VVTGFAVLGTIMGTLGDRHVDAGSFEQARERVPQLGVAGAAVRP
jgi:hypothetical protein